MRLALRAMGVACAMMAGAGLAQSAQSGPAVAQAESVVAQPGPAAAPEPVVGQKVVFPAITLMDGRTLPKGYFDGKPVVVEYWASWCPFCARQNPYLQKLSARARGTGLEVLTISIDKHGSDARTYLDKHHYTFQAALDTPELREVFGKRRVIPQIFVVKADGRVAEVIPGEMFEEDVLDLLKYAPRQPAASQ
jgi:thiol-disulfide isomerase/thioredoxin